jgi:hypothetical protein
MPTEFLVKGEWASRNEYNVSLALDYYKIPYQFHVDILGGSTVRGGFVIDFVVEIPFETPLEVFGNYWHEGMMASEDRLKLDMLRSYYGQFAIVIWGDESNTPEAAREAVRRKVL